MLQFSILWLLINFSLSLAIAYCLLLPVWSDPVFTYLFENLVFVWATNVNPLCCLLGKNCILQSILPLPACEVRRDWGPSPSLEESLGFWASCFSETQFLICKMGNDNIEFSGLFRTLMRDKYKAFIIKPRLKDSFIAFSLHYAPCCFLHCSILLHL